MDFLGFLGTSELLIIAVVTLIVFGPNRLPELARHLAKFSKLIREASREIQRQIDMSDLQLDLDKPPKPKKAAATSTPKTDYSYPYGEGDEGDYYSEMGKEETGNESEFDRDDPASGAAPVHQTASVGSAPRLIVDEDLKTQDAARLQREFLD